MNEGELIRRLGQFLEECERHCDACVRLHDRHVSVTADHARASLELTLSTTPEASTVDAALADDGTLSLVLDETLPTESTDVRLDVDGITLDAETITITLTATVEAADASVDATATEAPNRGGSGVRYESPPDSSHDGPVATARDSSVPPFEDRPYLVAIYESCETFAEMADVIDMDVTAETVRRYMMQHDVHEPTSYDTAASEGSAERTAEPDLDDAASSSRTTRTAESAVVADGMGLPESVTVADLVDAVERANTIREVGRAIGLDRMDALDLLQRLDLLEFVMGRLSTEGDHDVSRERILEHVRHAAGAPRSRRPAPS